MQEDEVIRRAKKLIRRYDDMRIVGSRGEWSGDARQGFMFNPQRGGGSAGGAPTPPPAATGACCIGTDCSITTEQACIDAGGTYQGDNTTCDPNPCAICCAFRISATGEGLDDGIPFSCTLPETLVAFPCCDEHGSGFNLSIDCEDPDNPPGSLNVFGVVIFSSSFPGEWELQLQVGAFGSINGNLNIGDSCIGGPLVISGDAFPPDPMNSAFYTGSVETVIVTCPP